MAASSAKGPSHGIAADPPRRRVGLTLRVHNPRDHRKVTDTSLLTKDKICDIICPKLS